MTFLDEDIQQEIGFTEKNNEESEVLMLVIIYFGYSFLEYLD